MGNPHAVLFLDDIFNADVSGIGAELTAHPAYPNGANVGFCQVIDRHFVRLRVYERGVGETLACGSGACAAVVAARLHGMVDERVKVSLPGGKLRIAWPGPGEPVKMSGGATLVYRGELQREQ
jgi:diaminopimelate epimerase